MPEQIIRKRKRTLIFLGDVLYDKKLTRHRGLCCCGTSLPVDTPRLPKAKDVFQRVSFSPISTKILANLDFKISCVLACSTQIAIENLKKLIDVPYQWKIKSHNANVLQGLKATKMKMGSTSAVPAVDGYRSSNIELFRGYATNWMIKRLSLDVLTVFLYGVKIIIHVDFAVHDHVI